MKKFGPSLKEIRLKDRKEWIPGLDQESRTSSVPDSKMPVFRLLDEEVQQISAYLWQNALDGELVQHPRRQRRDRGQGAVRDARLPGLPFDRRGRQTRIGGNFAANLSRVGEKMNYDYMVRWIHDPSEVTPDPDVPDEMRPRPIMPSLRLTTRESRDIAAYLSEQRTDAEYPDSVLHGRPGQWRPPGEAAIRHYGCAGCHEISGLEEEGPHRHRSHFRRQQAAGSA